MSKSEKIVRAIVSKVIDDLSVDSFKTEVPKNASIFTDLGALRLHENYQADVAVRRVLTSVPVGKPNRHEFVRVHPGEDFRLDTFVLDSKEDHEVYIITREARVFLVDEMVPVTLYLSVNRQGFPRIWSVKLPGADGRQNAWHESAARAARRAMTQWTRIAANMQLGAYEVHEAVGQLSDPQWPTESFGELLDIAFKGRIIDSADHPVVQRLRGEV